MRSAKEKSQVSERCSCRFMVLSRCHVTKRGLLLSLSAAVLLSSCATLAGLRTLIQPPRFEQADGRPAEIRFLQPSRGQPLGGAGVRVWTNVSNPNAFGLTISTLDTTLQIEGREAASGNFPLGLPLGARQESVIPIDLEIDFADLPAVATAIRRAVSGGAVAYALEGTIGVDAGPLGQPTFGPMLLVSGELRASRP
jgi:Late embryogenesis abundant protein